MRCKCGNGVMKIIGTMEESILECEFCHQKFKYKINKNFNYEEDIKPSLNVAIKDQDKIKQIYHYNDYENKNIKYKWSESLTSYDLVKCMFWTDKEKREIKEYLSDENVRGKSNYQIYNFIEKMLIVKFKRG